MATAGAARAAEVGPRRAGGRAKKVSQRRGLRPPPPPGPTLVDTRLVATHRTVRLVAVGLAPPARELGQDGCVARWKGDPSERGPAARRLIGGVLSPVVGGLVGCFLTFTLAALLLAVASALRDNEDEPWGFVTGGYLPSVIFLVALLFTGSAIAGLGVSLKEGRANWANRNRSEHELALHHAEKNVQRTGQRMRELEERWRQPTSDQTAQIDLARRDYLAAYGELRAHRRPSLIKEWERTEVTLIQQLSELRDRGTPEGDPAVRALSEELLSAEKMLRAMRDGDGGDV